MKKEQYIEKPVDAIEWNSTRQREQYEEKDDRQRKKALHSAYGKTLAMGPDSRTEESEELDPKQFYLINWMVKGVLDRVVQIKIIEGGVTIVG